MPKKAFTLIEMMVVMGLIAIFSLLGAGAFLSTRNQQILDSATQELLGKIREAQNNAISVKKDTISGSQADTKAWGIHFRDEGYYFGSYNYDGVEIVHNSEMIPLDNVAITNRVLVINNVPTNANTFYIVFNSPFGSPYLMNRSCTGADDAFCSWAESKKATKEFEPVGNTSTVFSPRATNADTYLLVTLSYRNLSNTVRINTNGEAYVQ